MAEVLSDSLGLAEKLFCELPFTTNCLKFCNIMLEQKKQLHFGKDTPSELVASNLFSLCMKDLDFV